ncbi:adenylate/guanylate cyclase domain-containing protein [Thalassolituus maritimus]|jgi:class 3 adenylate cyclase|uniref:Guanylate cyclase domain-containing protein n=1 Tax=Thalassolituus maritimus TaxID=484498 RepID=A0ABP9ZWL3_9GAMM|nr:adenylate/guanylate cyclase domain-containing protein [Pseudomonadota bacterium]
MSNLRTFVESLNTSQRAGLLAAVMVLIAGIILSSLTYVEVKSHTRAQLDAEQQRQLQHLGAMLTPALVRDDRITLNLSLSEWDAGAAMPAIRVLDRDGKPVASTGRIHADLSLTPVEIRQDGNLYGSLEGYTTYTPADTAATRIASQALLVTAALSLIAGLAGWLVSEKYARYLRQLRTKLSGWRDGDELTLPMGPADPDLQSLHSVLGDISKREQQRRAVEVALGQFMGTEETPFPDPMKYYNCAMLFIEIQDLELLQQRLSAEELTSTLNQYHRLLSQAAKLYNGKVDRYLGDGVVMLFGVPNRDRNAAMHCLYAARLFTSLVNHLHETNSDVLPLEFNVAAHWGPVLMAPLQDGVSTQYSLIGDAVHWAYHLASQSESRRIIASQTLIEMLEDGHDVIWSEGPNIRDLHGGVQSTYWLNQLPEKTESLIQRQMKHITSMTESA